MKDMADIQFIDQANLNQELFEFLTSQGYKEQRIEFILEEQKINSSTPHGKTKNDYFTDELYSLVKQKEKLLFKILNHLKNKDQMIQVTKTFLPPQSEYGSILTKAWNSGWITNRGELVKGNSKSS